MMNDLKDTVALNEVGLAREVFLSKVEELMKEIEDHNKNNVRLMTKTEEVLRSQPGFDENGEEISIDFQSDEEEEAYNEFSEKLSDIKWSISKALGAEIVSEGPNTELWENSTC